jgi:cytochrome b involved in lipid metabolism
MNKKIILIAGFGVVVLGLALTAFFGPTPRRESASPMASAPAAEAPSAEAASPSANSVLTMAEVAKHATAADCWTVVSGKVYDVTNLIGLHSGGAEAIIAGCGKDSTAAFMTRGQEPARPHPEKAAVTLESMLVGPLVVQPQ